MSTKMLPTFRHMIEARGLVTYTSVMFRESMQVALMITVLNTVGTINIYFKATHKEKIWTLFGLEFGEVFGQKAIVVRDLYSVKYAGVALRTI